MTDNQRITESESQRQPKRYIVHVYLNNVIMNSWIDRILIKPHFFKIQSSEKLNKEIYLSTTFQTILKYFLTLVLTERSPLALSTNLRWLLLSDWLHFHFATIAALWLVTFPFCVRLHRATNSEWQKAFTLLIGRRSFLLVRPFLDSLHLKVYFGLFLLSSAEVERTKK